MWHSGPSRLQGASNSGALQTKCNCRPGAFEPILSGVGGKGKQRECHNCVGSESHFVTHHCVPTRPRHPASPFFVPVFGGIREQQLPKKQSLQMSAMFRGHPTSNQPGVLLHPDFSKRLSTFCFPLKPTRDGSGWI